MRQRWSIVLGLSFWLLATAAQAATFNLGSIPAGPVNSDNGSLQFSNIQFFSPFGTVAGSNVTLTTLNDGIRLSGPVSVTGTGMKSFFVLYDVKPLTGGINFASLLLDSQVDANGVGLVLATKKILDQNLTPEPFTDWWKPGGGQGNDDLLPLLGTKLANLKTADWDVDQAHCANAPFGNCDGAIRQVEAGFNPQTSIRVIESITIGAIDGTAIWRSSSNHFQNPVPVPEPGVASLTLLGFALLSWRSRRRGH